MSDPTFAERHKARAIARHATKAAATGLIGPDEVAQRAAFHARPDALPARVAYVVRLALAVLTGRRVAHLTDVLPPYPKGRP